jgi:hypothetical protein
VSALPVALAMTFALGFGASCASKPDAARAQTLGPPSFDAFTGGPGQVGVSTFLERRCGSLDCHGQAGRPLRLYSQRGLRLAVDDVPGGLATSADELRANYDSLSGLEPELLTEVVSEGGVRPERLLFIKKPRLLEGHKGGAAIVAGDDGDNCLTSWLRNATDFTACAAASQLP